MRKLVLPVLAILSLIGLLTDCKDAYQNFSPGAGDPRIAGTWQLHERRFPKDSLYSIRIDTITTTRDTLFYVTKRYPATPPQTLTFDADGRLSASGNELSYYFPIKYYRVDSTQRDSVNFNRFVSLFINTNRANQFFQQAVEFKRDTLTLRPNCEQSCYLTFIRVR